MDRRQPLSDSDLARVAQLHVASIDDSLPALLGVAYARHLYRFLEISESELVLCERVEGQIESVCVVSFDPDTLQARIARGTVGALLSHGLRALLVNPAFRSFAWHTVADALRGATAESKAPEITYVFTNQQLRGQHLGQRLVERVDAAISERGIEGYYVKTLDDPANRALRFYDDNGFKRIGIKIEGGRNFVEFHKPLAPR